MKIIKRMIVLFLLIIPVLVTASTFNVEKNNVNNYMTRSNFKSTYRRYIMNKDSNEDKGKLMFYMDDNGVLSNKVDSKNINAGFTDGGFISKREYLLTVPEKGTSYLYDGSTYWTLTCNNESKKCFVIEYTGALDQSGISEYLNYTTSPNIRSKATEFVKKDTKVTGTGKFKVTLGDKSYDLKKDIYLRHKENFYSDSGYTNILYNIKSLNDGNLPERDGYKFLGYFISSPKTKIIDENGKVVDKVSVNKDKTILVSNWENLKYKVTFDPNGGKIIRGQSEVIETFDKKYENLPEAGKAGSSFEGWYTEASGGTKVTGDTDVTTSHDHVLYAHYKACLVGTYNTGNSTACTKCPRGYTSSAGSTAENQCYMNVPAGKYLVARASSSTNCPTGQHREGNKTIYYGGSIACTNCGIGKYQDQVGQATCKTCPSGYTSVVGTKAENKCYMNVPSGKQLVAKAASPTNCSAGTARNGAVTKYYGESVSCSACAAGKYSRAGASTCTNCVAGSYSAAGSSKCTGCAGGKTSSAGSSSCTKNCLNNAGVASWKTAVWNTNNTVNNSCAVNSCINTYQINGNSCKLKQVVWDFYYTGGIQTLPIPYTGTYTLEVWGAQGGSCTSPSQSKGGLGGYSKGKKYLTAGSNLYIVIGGTSNTSAGGYNGGGNGAYSGGTYESAPQQALGGGGATHIATRSGLLSSLSNYTNTILIVAAGGGGSGFNGGCNRGTNCYGIGRSTCHVAGGYGGGEYGGNGEDDVNSASTLIGKGASQSGPGSKASNESCGVGSFGKGGDYCNERYGGAGGGGGWYGGGGSSRGHAGGGGGSSYIGGVSNGSMSSGVRSGNGFARITFAQ